MKKLDQNNSDQDRVEALLDEIKKCVQDISNSLKADVKLYKKQCKEVLCLAGELNDIIRYK